jgi:hypothetical protein
MQHLVHCLLHHSHMPPQHTCGSANFVGSYFLGKFQAESAISTCRNLDATHGIRKSPNNVKACCIKVSAVALSVLLSQQNPNSQTLRRHLATNR